MMCRELGAIAELQTAETILKSDGVSGGFDATTQEVHINSVHFTTDKECCAGSLDELAGGLSDDYAEHICATIDNLNETYSYFNEIDKQQTKKKIIDNIKNSMSGGSQVILLLKLSDT